MKDFKQYVEGNLGKSLKDCSKEEVYLALLQFTTNVPPPYRIAETIVYVCQFFPTSIQHNVVNTINR